MRKVCILHSHNNKIVWLWNMADTMFPELHEVRKGIWAFFLDCDFRMLIGWAGKLRSRRECCGLNVKHTKKVTAFVCHHVKLKLWNAMPFLLFVNPYHCLIPVSPYCHWIFWGGCPLSAHCPTVEFQTWSLWVNPSDTTEGKEDLQQCCHMEENSWDSWNVVKILVKMRNITEVW